MKPIKTALAGLFTLLAAGSAHAQSSKYEVVTEYLWACTDDSSAQTVTKIELAISRLTPVEKRKEILGAFNAFAVQQLRGVNGAFYEQIDKRGLLPRTHAELASNTYFHENKREIMRLRTEHMADFAAAIYNPIVMSGCGLEMKEKAFVYMFAEKLYKDSMIEKGFALSPTITFTPTAAVEWPLQINRIQ